MNISNSNNLMGKLSCWFENEIAIPCSRYYYRKKKAHYKCTVCGRIEAPYFAGKRWSSITKDMGWHRFKDSNQWICHHCADHGFESSYEEYPWTFTWDQWQEYIKVENDRILRRIKEKDYGYYHYWFEGGRELELFGDDEDDED